MTMTLKELTATATAQKKVVTAAARIEGKAKKAYTDAAEKIFKKGGDPEKVAALLIEYNAAASALEFARAALVECDKKVVRRIRKDNALENRVATTEERESLFRARAFDLIISNAMKERARLNHDFSIQECEKYLGLHITSEHNGKMSGMESLSTSPFENATCEARAKIKGSICEKCFSRSQISYMSSMSDPLAYNTALLSYGIIPAELLPVLNNLYFRIESFGDIASPTHARNYLNLIRKNPLVNFAWWTKNPGYLNQAINAEGITSENRPGNVQFILSSLYRNRPGKVRYWWINKVFTVYDPEVVQSENIAINCGKLHCISCLRCYRPNPDGVAVVEVREELK